MRHTRRLAGWGIFFGLYALAPVLLSSYWQHLLIMTAFGIILAVSLNIPMGLAGQISFAQAAFYGIGAYASALLAINLRLSFWLALPAAALVTALLGLAVGVPTLRLRGPYFAITTIGLQEVAIITMLQWTSLTRGPMGIVGIPRPALPFGEGIVGYFYFIWLVLIVTIIVAYRIAESPIGLHLVAVREDETAARSVGVNTAAVKIFAFVISAMMAGAAGSLYAHYIGSIDPYVFHIVLSAGVVVMVLIGGQGTVVGPVLGAILLTIVPELLRAAASYRLIVYGVVLMLTVRFLPSGLVGLGGQLASLRGRILRARAAGGAGILREERASDAREH